MQPHLGIAYQSGANETALGPGFALTGLSGIGRCGHTLAQDGDVRPIMLDAQDGFCLDGERLELQHDGQFYHTEHESWQQIQIRESDANGPLSFVVTQPDGVQRLYGSTTDSRIMATRVGDGARVVRSWLISAEVDPSGNLVEYNYGHAPATISDTMWRRANVPTRDFVRIASIVYTGTHDQGGDISGNRRVTFEYATQRGPQRAATLGTVVIADDTQPVGGFANGSYGWAASTTPLVRIRTFVGDDLVHLIRLRGGDGSPTDTEQGAPRTAAHQYRLYEIQLCTHAPPQTPSDRDAEGDPVRPSVPLVCMPATHFEWFTRTESPQATRDPGYGFETFEHLDRFVDRLRSPFRPVCAVYADGISYCGESHSNPVILSMQTGTARMICSSRIEMAGWSSILERRVPHGRRPAS
jgi:hypothetical protein